MIADAVGESLEGTKALRLRFGRMILLTPRDANSIDYLLTLSHLEEVGCTIVSVAEHAQRIQPDMIQVHVLFRMPAAVYSDG